MKKLKIMTVVGTRPEIIRLSRVIAVLDRDCEHCLVHTGQNFDYELNQIFFNELEIRRPDHFLEAAGSNACETIGRIIERLDKILESEKPDALLILGDTNSCLSAYPARRKKIPVFHMEAGNRCFDQRVPEEINRKIVDHIADFNLPYSAISREYLLREGLPPDRIIKTGSPMYEVLHYYRPKIDQSDILDRLKLKPGEYFVLSTHREENVESQERFLDLVEIMNGLSSDFKMPVIVTTHPRTRKMFDLQKPKLAPEIRLEKPFGFCDYIKLEIQAAAVLSDSGTITEESSILDFPALNIREAHERPEGMEEAAVMMVGTKYENVRRGLAILSAQPWGGEKSRKVVGDYNVPNVSEKILRIIVSYTDYVNRTVWKKSDLNNFHVHPYPHENS